MLPIAEDRTTSTEIWKDLPQFPKYQISNLGNLRSFRKGRWKPRKAVRYKGGYWRVALRPGGKGPGKLFSLHCLVLEAFVGPCPEGMECRHKDGDSDNNRLDNLEWSTHLDNMRDRKAHGTDNMGARHPMAKMTDEDVHELRRLRADGWNRYQLAERFGISPSTAKKIYLRLLWQHI